MSNIFDKLLEPNVVIMEHNVQLSDKLPEPNGSPSSTQRYMHME